MIFPETYTPREMRADAAKLREPAVEPSLFPQWVRERLADQLDRDADRIEATIERLCTPAAAGGDLTYVIIPGGDPS